MQIGLRSHSSFPILPGQAVHTCLGSENCSPDRFVLRFQRRINILRTEKGKLSGYGRKGVNVRPISIEFTQIGVLKLGNFSQAGIGKILNFIN